MPEGFTQLASDGVYRSFSSRGEVVDFKQFSPVEGTKMLEFLKNHADSEEFQKSKKIFDSVDGRNGRSTIRLIISVPNSSLGLGTRIGNVSRQMLTLP